MTVIDPNSTVPTAFEVRVTRRGVRLTSDGAPQQVSTRSDFIAPDLSAPSTHAVESEKGKRGWTFHDKRLPEAAPYNPKTGRGSSNHIPTGGTMPYDARVTVGKTVIRRSRDNGMRSTYKINKRAR